MLIRLGIVMLELLSVETGRKFSKKKKKRKKEVFKICISIKSLNVVIVAAKADSS